MAVTPKFVGLTRARQNIKRTVAFIGQELWDEVRSDALLVEKHLKLKKLSGNPVNVRSGRTRASIHTQFFREQFTAKVGTDVKWGRMLEMGTKGLPGGRLTPKTAKVLTIPLAAARTRTGKTRGSAREVGRRYDATFWKLNDKRQLILYGVRLSGTSATLTPLFIGLKSVKIKGKFPFKETQKELTPKIARNFEGRISRFVEKQNR